MTLVQLRCFAAIVDAGFNITQAAAQVHATQPALSKQLKQLEDALGYRLFLRHGRSLVDLTPAGRQVLEHTRRLLGEARNIRALAANQRAEAEGELRIVTTHTQARFVLPPALAALRRAWPRTSIHLEPAADAEVLASLDRGEADVALISSSGSEPSAGVAIPLYRWRRVVVVPRGHALAQSGVAPTLAALAEVPLVSYESSSRADSSLASAFDNAGLMPRLAMTARDADVIKTCVREGIGVGLLAEMAVGALSDPDLAVLEAPAAIPGCITWAVLPRERVLRDYTVDLLRHLAPQLDRHDLRRVVAGHAEARWPAPPDWRDLCASISS